MINDDARYEVFHLELHKRMARVSRCEAILVVVMGLPVGGEQHMYVNSFEN